MKVNHIKSDYCAMSQMWQKMRDVISGQEAVKNRGEVYLPPLNGQERIDYDNYKNRAIYYNATGRTSSSYIGMIFRKQPVISFPEKTEDLFRVVTQDGKTMDEFLVTLTKEVVDVNRVGVLVDIPNVSTENLSLQDVETANIRPYWIKYTTEQIINWDTTVVNNKLQLSLVVLSEMHTVQKNVFEEESIQQYRVLRLENDVYVQEVYREIKKGEKGEFALVEKSTPLKDGQPLSFIPFYIITENGVDYSHLPKPLLSDMADVNVGHYKNSADYENELHWSGIKTVVFPGGKRETGKTVKLGKVLLTDSVDSKPYILEASAGSAIEKEMTNKERRMVALGAEQIIEPVSSRQTATGQIINSTSKNSTVAKIANAVSVATTEMLKFTMSWMPVDLSTVKRIQENLNEIKIELNTDFLPARLSGPELLALVQTWQKSVIDMQTLRWNLRQGEIIPSEKTDEEIQENIDNDPPVESSESIL